MKVVTCCGCYSLRTGTIIIGANGILMIVPLISLILNFKTDVLQGAIKTDYLDLKPIKIINAGFMCIYIGMSMLLIIGALKRNTYLMLLWLVLEITLIVGRFVYMLTGSIMSFMNNQVLLGVGWLIFVLIVIVISTYFWLVVYSYRKELLQEKIIIRMGLCESPHNYQQLAEIN